MEDLECLRVSGSFSSWVRHVASLDGQVPDVPRHLHYAGHEMAWAHASIYTRHVNDAKRVVAGQALASASARNLLQIRELEERVRRLYARVDGVDRPREAVGTLTELGSNGAPATSRRRAATMAEQREEAEGPSVAGTSQSARQSSGVPGPSGGHVGNASGRSGPRKQREVGQGPSAAGTSKSAGQSAGDPGPPGVNAGNASGRSGPRKQREEGQGPSVAGTSKSAGQSAGVPGPSGMYVGIASGRSGPHRQPADSSGHRLTSLIVEESLTGPPTMTVKATTGIKKPRIRGRDNPSGDSGAVAGPSNHRDNSASGQTAKRPSQRQGPPRTRPSGTNAKRPKPDDDTDQASRKRLRREDK